MVHPRPPASVPACRGRRAEFPHVHQPDDRGRDGKTQEIVKTFGVPTITVKRYVKLYRDHGAKGFYGAKPRHSSASVLLSSAPWPYPRIPPSPRSRVSSSARDTCGKRFRFWIWRSTISNNRFSGELQSLRLGAD